jgi:hypothetical protein
VESLNPDESFWSQADAGDRAAVNRARREPHGIGCGFDGRRTAECGRENGRIRRAPRTSTDLPDNERREIVRGRFWNRCRNDSIQQIPRCFAEHVLS